MRHCLLLILLPTFLCSSLAATTDTWDDCPSLFPTNYTKAYTVVMNTTAPSGDLKEAWTRMLPGLLLNSSVSFAKVEQNIVELNTTLVNGEVHVKLKLDDPDQLGEEFFELSRLKVDDQKQCATVQAFAKGTDINLEEYLQHYIKLHNNGKGKLIVTSMAYNCDNHGQVGILNEMLCKTMPIHRSKRMVYYFACLVDNAKTKQQCLDESKAYQHGHRLNSE